MSYKENQVSITRSLAKHITNYTNQESLGSRLRAKRIIPLLRVIEKLSEEYDTVNIIDIGGTEEYWGIVPSGFLETRNVKITIVNLPGNPLPENHDLFTFIHSDGCNLDKFENDSFHIAHSNSVIEHVGDWSRMTQFANELKRVSQKYYVQTPSFWFPIEPHCMTPFFHWLPKPLRVRLVMRYALGHWSKAASVEEATKIVDSARLLNRKKFRSLFSNSQILTERLFFMPKSFVAIRK
jgi:hypothetical protein